MSVIYRGPVTGDVYHVEIEGYHGKFASCHGYCPISGRAFDNELIPLDKLFTAPEGDATPSYVNQD